MVEYPPAHESTLLWGAIDRTTESAEQRHIRKSPITTEHCVPINNKGIKRNAEIGTNNILNALTIVKTRATDTAARWLGKDTSQTEQQMRTGTNVESE